MRFTRRLRASALAAAMLLGAITLAQAQELRPYPRAQELGRYDNPLEVGALPISPPERAKGKNESRWRLPYEGKVSIQQFKHPGDDSPLLIARHYAGQLREQGFELVTICDIPCKPPGAGTDASVYWFHELDLAKKLTYSAFGDRGMYLIGHRPDAVVAVRVGQGQGGYVSAVKTISAAQLDRAPLLAYVERQRAPVADAPLPAPPGRQAPVQPPAPGATAPSPHVTDVAPAEIGAWLRQSKGWVVLQLSSYDSKCTYCMPGNTAFNALAQKDAPAGFGFVRVPFQPWSTVGQNEFAKLYSVGGIPAFLTFKDGQLVRRRDGTGDEATLRRELIDGLR